MPNKKLVVYIMYPNDKGGHPFLVVRRTAQNKKGRYVTGDEILKVGVLWPTAIAKTEDELAMIIGKTVLDEVNPPTYVIPASGLQQQLKEFRKQMMDHDTSQAILDEEAQQEIEDEEAAADNTDDDEGTVCWEDDARDAINHAVESAHWDHEEGGLVLTDQEGAHRVCLTHGDLRTAIDEIGGNAWCGSAPRDDGDWVFDWHDQGDSFIEAGIEKIPETLRNRLKAP